MSAIEWTVVTWNPTVGCARVSAGCIRCYAEPSTERVAWLHKGVLPHAQVTHRVGGEVRFNGKVLRAQAMSRLMLIMVGDATGCDVMRRAAAAQSARWSWPSPDGRRGRRGAPEGAASP